MPKYNMLFDIADTGMQSLNLNSKLKYYVLFYGNKTIFFTIKKTVNI